MSWTNELYRIYELNCGREFDGDEPLMLPISHSTANAQIEIKLDEEGNFKGAGIIDKADAETIIPVTEDSGARSSGICPMPFADKLVYIAGDYKEYAEGKRSDNTDFYTAYMNQLVKWCKGEYTHKAVEAVYSYLEKSTVMRDLIDCDILKLDEATGKLLAKTKISGIAQEDSFVRFIVYCNDVTHESRTWKDKSLYDSFINFNSSAMGSRQLCYAFGTETAVTYKHPSKIRNSGDKAKLISSNDESGFTYRGRFSGKEEAISVSYEFSQKMHNALKWLISKQAMRFDTLTVIVWASGLQPVPDVRKSGCEGLFDDEDDEDDILIPDTVPKFRDVLRNMIFGYKQSFDNDTKVMLMGLDAATTGRLSISLYSELNGSEYLENIKKWHEETVWYRRINGKNLYNSFNIKDIINCAYGIETNGLLECSEALKTETILKVIPCITQGRKIPHDLVRSLYHKASNPLAYGEKGNNHRKVLEVACGMIRKEHIDYQLKGEITMAYNPKETDRNYLYGCLLALADKIERATYENGENRPTNAKRYWNMFSKRPFTTWGIIYDRLIPYMKKLETNKYGLYVKYMNQMDEIKAKFNTEEFINNAALTPLYLLGYHHYNALLYSSSKKEEE